MLKFFFTPSRAALLLVLIASAFILINPPGMLSGLQLYTLIILLITLTLWATSALPEFQTSLLFFLSAILFEVATPTEIFSGFASGALWLIFAGMVIGMAITNSGMSDRIAGYLGHHLERSYPWLIGGLMLTCTLLGFVMPSSIGRLVMMIPIGMALADRCGFHTGSKGRTGVVMAVTFGCHLPTFSILPSNIPNMVMIGSAETIYGLHFSYTDYLLLHFPILGAIKAIIIALLIIKLLPAEPNRAAAINDLHQDPSLRAKQRKLSIVLLTALAFWLTDSWHGINPAWVGLAAACFLLLPKVGMVDQTTFNKQINFSMLIFIAGVLGLGALVNSSGLGKLLAVTMEHVLPLNPGADAVNFISLTAMSFFTGMFSTLPGVPAVLTPVAADLANQTGMTVQAVIMTQVVGFSTILFPYQSGPLIVGMQLAREPIMSLLRITVPLTLITWVILIPLDYLWWQALSMFTQ
ncbi:SLC13 family permease [Neptunomonas phycophila]|uniref:SLC13 family permease n=1 Tax=Neptunomonas phycophila TaxID=1572645 RepID=UPI0026E3ADA6|nr:SLC13 family permease [Neptunomonas phycophila]MDO6782859.1 SLC13 family permease [Neptunomonas phycophila]